MKHCQHACLVVSVENFPLQGQKKHPPIDDVFLSNKIVHMTSLRFLSPPSSRSHGSKRHIAIDIDFASVTRQKQCLKSMAKCSGHQMEFRDVSRMNKCHNNQTKYTYKHIIYVYIYNKIKNKLDIYCLSGSCSWSSNSFNYLLQFTNHLLIGMFCETGFMPSRHRIQKKDPRSRKKLRRRRLKSWGSPCSCDFGNGEPQWLKVETHDVSDGKGKEGILRNGNRLSILSTWISCI